jgi:hypothetical protein
MIYSINYDLKQPGRDYSGLYEAIKGCGVWWHYLDSTWLTDTALDAAAIWKRLAPYVDGNDWLLVIGVNRDYEGWLPQEARDWINTRRSQLAA